MVRTAAGKPYVRVERDRPTISWMPAILVCFCCLVLVLVSFAASGIFERTRQEFLDRLKNERQALETNKALKTELFAITQRGYLELAAEERLGLKRPKDEEVVVLR